MSVVTNETAMIGVSYW